MKSEVRTRLRSRDILKILLLVVSITGLHPILTANTEIPAGVAPSSPSQFLELSIGSYTTIGGYEPIDAISVGQLSIDGHYGWSFPIMRQGSLSALLSVGLGHVDGSRYYGIYGFDSFTLSLGAEIGIATTIPLTVAILGSVTTSRFLHTRNIFSYLSASVVPSVALFPGPDQEGWYLTFTLRFDLRRDLQGTTRFGAGLRYTFKAGRTGSREVSP